MGKRNYRGKPKKIDVEIVPEPVLSVVDQTKPSKLGILWQKFKGHIVFFSVIVAIVATYEPIMNLFKTPHEKYREEKFQEGDLRPEKLPHKYVNETPISFHLEPGPIKDNLPKIKGIWLKNYKETGINIVVGGEVYLGVRPDFLTLGKNILASSGLPCEGHSLILGLKDDRLYVSVKFNDLQEDKPVGDIEFNHWRLYTENMYDFRSTDKSLEVIDHQQHVILSINYDTKKADMPTVNISGYFISAESVLILKGVNTEDKSSNCIKKTEKNWKQKAEIKIAKIKSVF